MFSANAAKPPFAFSLPYQPAPTANNGSTAGQPPATGGAPAPYSANQPYPGQPAGYGQQPGPYPYAPQPPPPAPYGQPWNSGVNGPAGATGPYAPQAVGPRHRRLAGMLADLQRDVTEARKCTNMALAAEGADAGENLLPLGDGFMDSLANYGTAAASQAAEMKANNAVTKAKNKEEEVCRYIQQNHPEFSSTVTYAKGGMQLGSHKELATVNGWLDTCCDVLGCCSGACDPVSWYLMWRLNNVRTGLDQLDGNITRLRQQIAMGH